MRKLAVVWACLFLLTAAASAQSTFGVVLGTVKDSSGAIISGATVRLTNTGENTSHEAISDNAGNYDFQNVKPGSYSVTVTQKGFRSSTIRDIALEARQTIRVDATLQVGEVTQTAE